jgi:hypothetical protein
MLQSFQFSEFEKKRLLFWANENINEAYHWGDGSAYLPEEDMILRKFGSDQEEIELTDQEVRILWSWVTRILGSQVMVGEDMVIGRKVIKIYEAMFGTGNPEVNHMKQIIGGCP